MTEQQEPASPAPAPAPVNEVVNEADLPEQHLFEGPPTHVIWREDGPEFVHLHGFTEAAELELLPEGFWDLPMKADLGTRTFAPDLQAIQAAKWVEVKDRRWALENGVAPTPVGPVQCDDRSKLKISGLVQMVSIAIQRGRPFEEYFTLADNGVVLLTADHAIAMGEAVGRYVSAVHAASRVLRAQIFGEDATAAAILAIDVDFEFAELLDDLLASGNGVA